MSKIPDTIMFSVPGCTRMLRVCEVAPGVSIAVLKLATDPELAELAGRELARRVPTDVGVLVMPDGKAQSLLHVMGYWTGLPCVLARKSRKSYMREPVLDTFATSITTRDKHKFYLDADDVDLVRGKNVALVDDVVSSGGTYDAMRALLLLAGAKSVVEMAVATEGVGENRRPGVIALTHLPLYLHEES